MLSFEFYEIFKKTYHVKIDKGQLLKNIFIRIQLSNLSNSDLKRQSKIQNSILKILNETLPHRIRNDLCSENTKFNGDRVFYFPVGGFPIF